MGWSKEDLFELDDMRMAEIAVADDFTLDMLCDLVAALRGYVNIVSWLTIPCTMIHCTRSPAVPLLCIHHKEATQEAVLYLARLFRSSN